MPSSIEALKKAIPLAPFVASYTAGLKSSGHGFFIGRCPFHNGKGQRTFWVDSKHNVCGCFVPDCIAFCNKHLSPTSKPLDIINFYVLYHNVTNQQAIAELARKVSLPRE